MFFAATAPVLRRPIPTGSPRHLDQALERFLDSAFQVPTRRAPARLTQTDTQYTLALDLPGIPKAQLGITLEGQELRIETSADAPRPFKASYELPQDVDAAASRASLQDGVLTLTLARKQPVDSAVKIAID